VISSASRFRVNLELHSETSAWLSFIRLSPPLVRVQGLCKGKRDGDDHNAMFFLRASENIGCRWEFMGSENVLDQTNAGESRALAAIKINLNIYKIAFPL
jgi:hypothetical protein